MEKNEESREEEVDAMSESDETSQEEDDKETPAGPSFGDAFRSGS
ncbi:MAG TPA: hypothetical protein VFK89_05855 [Actinomycetota bacterium]|nr:hypothetical protein [Actinomycetota bacterium]